MIIYDTRHRNFTSVENLVEDFSKIPEFQIACLPFWPGLLVHSYILQFLKRYFHDCRQLEIMQMPYYAVPSNIYCSNNCYDKLWLHYIQR